VPTKKQKNTAADRGANAFALESRALKSETKIKKGALATTEGK
jgi:hypothetical protein